MSDPILVQLRVFYRNGDWMYRLDAVCVPGEVSIRCSASVFREVLPATMAPRQDLRLTVRLTDGRRVDVVVRGWERKLAGGGRWGSGLMSLGDVVKLCRFVRPSGSVEWLTGGGRLERRLREEGVLP